MICSKFGGDCPDPAMDKHLVFVMTPFKREFNNIFDQIKIAVHGIEGKNFKCLRADDVYTNLSIWCECICKNIRKARYLIVDTTGKSPNVFYELGFSHALNNIKSILITQNIKDAPFDIADFNHIVYDEENLHQLRDDIVRAIKTLEEKEKEIDDIYKSRVDIKNQLRQEEKRANMFKQKLYECEEREEKIKERIREIEAAQIGVIPSNMHM
jgi:DNA repair exonuclease SbcCD ATPase subunit